MKYNKLTALCLTVSILLTACAAPGREPVPDTGSEETAAINETADCEDSMPSDPMQKRLEQRCKEIVSLYYDLYQQADKSEPQARWDTPVLAQSSIDAIEDLLTDAGLDMVDTSEKYPDYLETPENFYGFWDAAQHQEAAEQEVITVRSSGTLSYQMFSCRDGVTQVYSMLYPPDGNSELYYEKHEVLDWTLTDRGNFYYRIYPAGDKHYADYTMLRLTPPDPELWDLNRTYIPTGSYTASNLFLTDWTENDFGALSFNDLWEYLYLNSRGEPFRPDGYAYVPERSCYKIPGATFENIVLPYFDIDPLLLRELAQYNAAEDYYPWRPVESNDYVFLDFYSIDPEVTAYQVNPDGTITLTVQVLSTDLKTDCLFAHVVTVRPLENGRFQYVGNEVTYQTEYGLPYSVPRLTWK